MFGKKFYALVKRTPHQPNEDVAHSQDLDSLLNDAKELNRHAYEEGDPTFVVQPREGQEQEASRWWHKLLGGG